MDIRYEDPAAGTQLSLSGGPGGWVDDAIAGVAVVVIAFVLVSGAQRWLRAQGGHPREVLASRLQQVQDAGSTAVRAWRGGKAAEVVLPADDGADVAGPVSVSVSSPSGR